MPIWLMICRKAASGSNGGRGDCLSIGENNRILTFFVDLAILNPSRILSASKLKIAAYCSHDHNCWSSLAHM